jgi:hypothetical protein
MDYVVRYFSELYYLVGEMAPWLLLGLVFAGLLKVYFPQKHIDKYLGKSSFKSAVNASLLGVPMPLCSCGVIPTGISFYKNGASRGATNSFLISTPQTGVDSIFATYSMLGWPFAILRPIVAFVTGIFGGVLTNLLIKDKPKVVPLPVHSKFAGLKLDTVKLGKSNESCPDDSCGCHETPKAASHPLIKAANYAFVELLQDIAKWLILGFLIAALISVLLPPDFFSLFKGYGFLEILIVLAASIPIYVCATGSIPIAAVLLMKGVSPGAALVFMMAGPATNVATITVIAKTMGKKSMFIYLASITGGAIFFGLLTNWFIPADFILSKMNHMAHGEAHEMFPKWVGIASSVILFALIVTGYITNRIQKNKKMTSEKFQTIKVEGMTCSHCEASITRNLSKLEGIEEVVADKNTSRVKIRGAKINLPEIERIVTDLGYQYKGSVL